MSNKVPQLRFNGYSDAWVQRNLGEVVDVKSGRDYKHLSEGDIPVYGTGGYMLSVDEALSQNDDAIGIGRKGTIDNPYLLRAPFWTVDTLFYAIPRVGFDLNFTFDIFQKVNWRKLDESTGVPSLSKATINSVSAAVPSEDEQIKIGGLFEKIDNLIAANQRKLDLLKEQKKGYLQKMFPKNGAKVPELRFAGFADDWEERKFGELYKKVNEKNDLSFGKDKVISVANMYFKDTGNIRSDDAYMKTYNIFRMGDIAFEGNRSKHFSYGRFVENTIGDGIVSHVFDVFRPIQQFDLNYWKYAIHNERVMGPILMTATTSSTMMTNLVAKDFLKRAILVPSYSEQKLVGSFFKQLDDTIALHQRKLDLLKEQKKGFLQKMFV
ncbi:restriction endonuclease subunit S [Weissella cibaria]|uniref:restriction endonuclease subunit S n=1 Tax=Weissella cibaria TaxID=137591 RepID=UPI001C1F744F|nr:restriction endonuclease subunit S [Weissella cibaria]MBU7545492.1 restriction endonuclease subunit S [Weissella cibaria]MCV3318773.1 restriction endonuclease subunit S [Weissella cibaria]